MNDLRNELTAEIQPIQMTGYDILVIRRKDDPAKLPAVSLSMQTDIAEYIVELINGNRDMKIKDNYPDGACPDCFADIPDDAVEGDACQNCTHVFSTYRLPDDLPACGQAKDILNRIGDEQGWNDDSKIHLLCDFIESNDQEGEFEAFLRNAQRNENNAGV